MAVKKKLTNYQDRMSKLVWFANIYGVVAAIAIWFNQLGPLAWLIYFSALLIVWSVAAGFDAVFDSLNERINIQSEWMHTRISTLENATNSDSGQEKWLKEAIPTDDPAHYFHSYPERKAENA
jgi:hypothetical protein